MVQQQPFVPAGTPFEIWLRQRRKALDLTQEKLAASIDVSLPTIVKIEAGERWPSREVAELLARCLQVPPDQLIPFMRLARAPLEGPSAGASPPSWRPARLFLRLRPAGSRWAFRASSCGPFPPSPSH